VHPDLATQFIGLWTILAFAVTAIARVGFAVAVHRDATKVGDRVMFVSPFLWAMGTLVAGAAVSNRAV
jgi:L-lactate permease